MRYRIYPDYTIQEAWEPPYSWMSDDYDYIEADSEDEALIKYKRIYG